MYSDILLYVPAGCKTCAAFIPGLMYSWFESKSWHSCIIFLVFVCFALCRWTSISYGFRRNVYRKYEYYTGKTHGAL